MEKLYNDFKIILKCYKWLNRINYINSTEVMNGINLFKSCEPYFYLIIDLVNKILEDRICVDYKKVLDLLERKKCLWLILLERK
jgi:hypothetical protein